MKKYWKTSNKSFVYNPCCKRWKSKIDLKIALEFFSFESPAFWDADFESLCFGNLVPVLVSLYSNSKKIKEEREFSKWNNAKLNLIIFYAKL